MIRLTERSLCWQIVAYASTIVELFAISYKACMPDAFKLGSNDLARELAGHTSG